MIKDTLTANEAVLPNSREMAVLKEYFPACFHDDGSFDLARFQEFLSDKVAITNEGYEIRFLGKNYARLLASVDTTTVIVPDEEHNSKPENAHSENVYISGDNLDGLKHLLKSYARKIKCIYIDPPYNTGSDGFVYNDSYNFTAEELSEKLSISEEQAKRILDLTKRGSASHSAWLMFMYSRLLLARDLLTDDGVIVISIDENERSNLKLLCDDVFGEQNFSGEIIWKNSSKNDQDYISMQHEYFLFYVRDKGQNIGLWKEEKAGLDSIFAEFAKLRKECGDNPSEIHRRALKWYNSFPASNPIRDSAHYSWYDDLDGVYFASDLSGPNYGQYRYDVIHPITKKVVKEPASGWRYPETTMLQKIEEGRIHFGPDETTIPNDKTYLKNTRMQSLTSIKYKDGRVASNKVEQLLGGKYFTNPKDDALLSSIFAALGIAAGDIVLDFFSGSSSTAEAVMRLPNAGVRYIMVQIPEIIAKDKPAYKAGFRTIDQIGMARIEKANQAILGEQPAKYGDFGFRHYTLVEPSRDTLDKLEQFSLEDNGIFITNTILEDFGVSTVIATWIVRDGYGFTAPLQLIDFAGYTGYYIGKHLYLINQDLNNEAIAAIAGKYETDGTFNPENVVLFGYSFKWTEMEALKTNLARLKDTEKNLRVNFDIRY